MMGQIREVVSKNGVRRYRFVIGVGRDPATGKRMQDSYTLDTREEAVAEQARIEAQVKAGTYVRREQKRIPSRRYKVAAVDLILTGRCSGQCLTAVDLECDCRCGGKYHGALQMAEVTLKEAQIPVVRPLRAEPLTPEGVAAAYLEGGLQAAREALGLSKSEACRRAGMEFAQLRRIELGTQGLSIHALLRLARVYGLDDLAGMLEPVARPNAWWQARTGEA